MRHRCFLVDFDNVQHLLGQWAFTALRLAGPPLQMVASKAHWLPDTLLRLVATGPRPVEHPSAALISPGATFAWST